MKLLLLLFYFQFFPLEFQWPDDIVKKIGIAMELGSSKEMINFCNETIEIKIDGKGRTNYSKRQAEMVLKDFFGSHIPKEFTYIHQGASPDGLRYTIGKLFYQTGSYRVVMFIKKTGDNYLIDTLTFSKE